MKVFRILAIVYAVIIMEMPSGLAVISLPLTGVYSELKGPDNAYGVIICKQYGNDVSATAQLTRSGFKTGDDVSLALFNKNSVILGIVTPKYVEAAKVVVTLSIANVAFKIKGVKADDLVGLEAAVLFSVDVKQVLFVKTFAIKDVKAQGEVVKK